MEMRHDIALAMDEALNSFPRVEDEFEGIFHRRYGELEAVACDDAETILVTSGTATSTTRLVIEKLRAQGEKVGLLKVKLFRPFPVERVRKILLGAKRIAVIDRNFSFGASGIFAQEIRAALCNTVHHPHVLGYVAGIGGRDLTADVIEDIYFKAARETVPERQSIWIGLKEA